MSVDELWQQALLRIQEQLGATPIFKTIFEQSRLLQRTESGVQVELPSRFAFEQIKKNRHDVLIGEVLNELEGAPIMVEFVIAAPGERSKPQEVAPSHYAPSKESSPTLGIINARYTFNTFVIGEHNRMAHAAAQRVAESPAKAYNPLFIYGDVGLGKTHLMHAIAHQVLSGQPTAKVAYLSSERFTNELVNAIKNSTAKEDRTMEFKNRYRTIDLLLIDDIQFMAGKEATQEEFFHTFNALHEAGKQIVISSDRPPRDIATLEARLRSRFEWGLIVDIQSPNLETRIAILQKKAEIENHYAGDDVLHYIAASYPTNVRELEGAFIRVMAYASLSNQVPSLALAQEALGNIAPPKQATVRGIIEAVSAHFHLDHEDLTGTRRTKDIAHARQVAMYLSRELTALSLNIIGEKFGNRDHTTVMYGIDQIRTKLGKDTALSSDVQKLVNKIKG
jgi:chromosomal replication initiator protein